MNRALAAGAMVSLKATLVPSKGMVLGGPAVGRWCVQRGFSAPAQPVDRRAAHRTPWRGSTEPLLRLARDAPTAARFTRQNEKSLASATINRYLASPGLGDLKRGCKLEKGMSL